MNIVLPKELAYSSLPALPEAQSIEVVNACVNGSQFQPGGLLQFDLINRGFIDPASLYIRYRLKVTGGTGGTLLGCPAYAVFNKLETILGSTNYESITNYNQVMTMWTNLQMDVAMKYGLQSAYGWSTGATAGIEDLDGRTLTGGDTMSFAVPLSCIISNCEKLVPMGNMPACRIQITLASIAEAFATTNAPTDYVVDYAELCYSVIDFAGGVNDMVKTEFGEKFYIKTSSFQNAMTPLSTGGTTELIFNMRLASIKSLFGLFYNSDAAVCINKIFDSVNPGDTAGGSDLVFSIAGTQFPSRPVSTLNNRSAVLMELKKAVGALHSDNYNFSINTVEFGRNAATVTTHTAPGKFIFGKQLMPN